MTRTQEASALSAARQAGILQSRENYARQRDHNRLTVHVSPGRYLAILLDLGTIWQSGEYVPLDWSKIARP